MIIHSFNQIIQIILAMQQVSTGNRDVTMMLMMVMIIFRNNDELYWFAWFSSPFSSIYISIFVLFINRLINHWSNDIHKKKSVIQSLFFQLKQSFVVVVVDRFDSLITIMMMMIISSLNFSEFQARNRTWNDWSYIWTADEFVFFFGWPDDDE